MHGMGGVCDLLGLEQPSHDKSSSFGQLQRLGLQSNLKSWKMDMDD